MVATLQLVWLILAASLIRTNAFSPSRGRTAQQLTSCVQRAFITTTALNAAPSSSTNKSREEELSNHAKRLEVTPTKLCELLRSQRQKLKDDNDPKARRIDWLLDDGANNVVDDRKKKQQQLKRDSSSSSVAAKSAAAVKKTKQPTAPSKKNKTLSATTTKKATTTSSKKKNNDASLLSNKSFTSRTDLHPSTKRALLETLGLTTMTDIQAKTYEVALSGKDVLGRARTGTGKTIAFLLPSIERLLRFSSTPEEYNERDHIGIVIISPTRELASQIGDEATKLLSFHKEMSVQVVFGGTKTSRDVSRLNNRLPTVLVATPGRLKDLLQSATILRRHGDDGTRRTKFATIMKQTPIIVLDETDQLLDMGFRREIQQILNYMGSSSSTASSSTSAKRRKKRQTLLFSATVPPALKEIMRQTMQDDYVEVDCIKDGAGGNVSGQEGVSTTGETHLHIEQSHAIISSMSQYVPSIIRVVKEAAADNGGGNKVVVFFPTARMVSFFADLFNEVVGLPVMELHSKKSQGYRNRVSGQFREAESGILFTSDVSARGVDYPGVSHVVQLGMPLSREQYIHRLGRTGRGGASGKGWLLLAPFESLFLEELTKINIPRKLELIDLLNKETLDETDDIMQTLMERVQNGDQVLNKSGEGAYQAFLGYYLGQMKRMRMKRKERLVEIANEFSASMGFRRPPALGANMVKKMGLDGITGIFVSNKKAGAKVNSNVPPKRDGRTRPKKGRWQRK